MNGTAPEIRDAEGRCVEDADFLLLLNGHHEPVAFRISHELYHGGWKISFDTARPKLELNKESVKRNRLVNLEARSLVLLSHER
jgi:glycogen operon protein